MKDIQNKFLAQNYNDNWDEYQYTLNNNNSTKWDYFIITASNERQAQSYREQIEYRLSNQWLPSTTKYIVIPDPDGKRVGSGGATLNVLKHLLNMSGTTNPFIGKRIVILHSGGDSKRVPQYSACGKLFSRVPRELPDGRCSTLFDEFVISLSGIPSRMSDGTLILSGDVLLLFDPLQIDLQREGTACISIKAPIKMGEHHGVFVSDRDNKVDKFLHKQSEETLINMGASNNQGNIDIDTGVIWLDGVVTTKLTKLFTDGNAVNDELFNAFVNDANRLNFYGDFVYTMTKSSTLDEYLNETSEGKKGIQLEKCRKEIWDILHNYPMHIIKLSPGKFIHFGTTLELRDMMVSAVHNYGFLGWKNDVMSISNTDTSVINSILTTDKISNSVYIEDSVIESDSDIGSGCIISNTRFNAQIPPNTVIHTLPLNINNSIKYVTRIYGVHDNPKKDINNDATLLGSKLAQLPLTDKISYSYIWNSEFDSTLWEANLYPICDTEEDAVNSSLVLIDILAGSATSDMILKWLTSNRISLHTSFELADTDTIIRNQLNTEDEIRVIKFINEVNAGKNSKKALTLLGESKQLIRRAAILAHKAKTVEFSTQYRLYNILSEICKTEKISILGLISENYIDLCYNTINSKILLEATQQSLWPTIDGTEIIQNTSVSLPVRLNWGGGWSDTPPYCLENGGTVLNAAISLNGILPIKVEIQKINRNVIILESKDIGCIKELTDVSEIRNYNNASDPFSLHKAALHTMGITEINQGMHIKSTVNVPKGSGLGTSSILAGAIVKALQKAYGLKSDNQSIFDQVLCIEQLITTGGGWQDQAGGLIDGVKLIRSKKGLYQKLDVNVLGLSDKTKQELNERLVLVYTGQRRLARNLLREIVSKYILGNTETIQILNEIQHLALLMSYELEKGNIDAFIELVNKHWKLSCLLDSGTTNISIDQIIHTCNHLIDGAFIAGAGGGGFIQLLVKKGISKDTVISALEEVYQDCGVEVWDSSIVW